MAEGMRIVEKAEGERQHIWCDTEKHFPFMTMERGWKFCLYCGGFKFKEGEKFTFPNLPKNEKGEDIPVESDIGCKNFILKRVQLVNTEPSKKEVQEGQLVDKKEEVAAAPKPEVKPEMPPKRRGILKFRK